MHPSEGELRRMIDEPEAQSRSVRAHAEGCEDCRARIDAFAQDAKFAHAALASGLAEGGLDAERALARLREAERTAAPARTRAVVDGAARSAAMRWRGGAIAAAAAVAVGAIAWSPVGTYATRLLTVFEPQQIQAVPVSQGLTTGLPDLNAYGTFSGVEDPRIETASSASVAQADAGFPAPTPSRLPASVGAPSYRVMLPFSASFTFSAQKAAAAAAKTGKTAPPMPAGLDGSTLRVSVGSGIVLRYPVPGAAAGTSGGAAAQENALIAAAVTAPTVTSTGAGATAIENYLLSLPGVPAALAADIRAAQDPEHTLPLPVPAGAVTSQKVTVNGASGVALAAASGLYNAVVWEASGRIYVVAGPFTPAQVMAAADSIAGA